MDAPAADQGGHTVRRGYRIHGRVQGVGFRWWTARNARELGLRGTVRNRPDGDVELHVEGAAPRVAALEDRLPRGPRAARVDGIEAILPSESLPADFRILR